MDSSKIAKDELILIEIKYFMALGNIFYIKQNFQEAKIQGEKASILANDDSKFTYDTIMEVKKLRKDLDSMLLKC